LCWYLMEHPRHISSTSYRSSMSTGRDDWSYRRLHKLSLRRRTRGTGRSLAVPGRLPPNTKRRRDRRRNGPDRLDRFIFFNVHRQQDRFIQMHENAIIAVFRGKKGRMNNHRPCGRAGEDHGTNGMMLPCNGNNRREYRTHADTEWGSNKIRK
jgi:hypothetical protein